MGVWYKALCHDCREYIDLDKIPIWPGYNEDCAALSFDEMLNTGELAVSASEMFVFSSVRLHYFIYKHNGHRLSVLDFDKAWDVIHWDEGTARYTKEEQYKEILPIKW